MKINRLLVIGICLLIAFFMQAQQLEVAGVGNPVQCLDGYWLFNPKPTQGFESQKQTVGINGWVTMRVPSEWYMEGYEVDQGQEAGYQHSFRLPDDWKGKRVMLRFGAVNSACRLFVNNQFVGGHIGAMLPFEFEITKFLNKKENMVSLYVKSESIAEQVGRISHYAQHQVGGILRHVYLVALPMTYISELNCNAHLDETLQLGTVTMDPRLNVPGAGKEIEVIVTRKGIEGVDSMEVEVLRRKVPFSAKTNSLHLELVLNKPDLWHAEKPNLYNVICLLYERGKLIEKVKQSVGFRKIDIIDNQMFVNGKTLKLYGVGLHEITPYGGRAIQDSALIERDIQLFKQANCNYIRTCHYPKNQYFMELCDRYGIFVEDEAPVCWVGNTDDNPKQHAYILESFKNLVRRDRHHPCVITWSIANESRWSKAFDECVNFAKKETPHIPVKFSHSEYFGIVGKLDVGARHYPGWEGLLKYQNYFRPIIFSEALHLNTYNTSENITDPGLRDLWGDYLRYFVENMEEAPAVSGMGIWSAIDEMYYPVNNLPVGYGPWGIVDGFRRQKPEYWHTKMSFSPIQVRSKTFHSLGEKTCVWVRNRFKCTDLNEIQIQWEDGQYFGSCVADCAPDSEGTLLIPHQMVGDILKLKFIDKRGNLLSSWKVPRNQLDYRMPTFTTTQKPFFSEKEDILEVRCDSIVFRFDCRNGCLLSVAKGEEEVVQSGIKLYLIPFSKSNEVIDFIPQDNNDKNIGFNSPYMEDWSCSRFEYKQDGTTCLIDCWGSYADSVPVHYTYRINGEAQMRVDYVLNLQKVATSNLRQIGIGFNLPNQFMTLNWKRDGLWSDYPEDHIGRTEGCAKAMYPETCVNYYERRAVPLHPYSKDGNDYGSNDFRSTKHNIFWATLSDDKQKQVTFYSNGKQHFRSWLNGCSVSCLLCNYSNGGNEHYLSYDSNRTRISEEEFKLDGGDFAGWIRIDFRGL